MGGKRRTAVAREAGAKNDKTKHEDPPTATDVTPAAGSPAVQANLVSSDNIVAAAAVPITAEAASTPVAGAEQTPSPASKETPQSTLGAGSTNKSTDQPVVAASQTALSAATATLSPTGSSESPSDASPIAAQGEITNPTTQETTSAYTSRMPMSTIGLPSPTQAPGKSPAESSGESTAAAAPSIASTPQTNIGGVVGGVTGALAFVGILLFLLWRCRKRGSRSSLLTPLSIDYHHRDQLEKYEFDNNSLGPTPRSAIWKAQAEGMYSRLRMDIVDSLSSFKAKLGRERDSPSVDMDRWKSGHSNPSSSVTDGHNNAPTTRGSFKSWFGCSTENVNSIWRLSKKSNDSVNPCAATRSTSEKRAETNQTTPDQSQFLAGKGNELRQAADPGLGSSGPNFDDTSDPFADRSCSAEYTMPNLSKPPAALVVDSFADPNPTSSLTSDQRTSGYCATACLSRGLPQSMHTNSAPATRPRSGISTNSLNPGSRHPSTICSSQDSYPDTIISALSVSSRKAKARSDPFDLDHPDL